MARISQRKVNAFLAAARTASVKKAQGNALEDLVAYVFEAIPGITVTSRNAVNEFHSEELDVAFWNDQHHLGLRFLPNLLLAECKNWSAPVGSAEVAWFDSKLRRRGLPFGILIAANGITGDPGQHDAAHETIAAAMAEQRRIVVITTEEIKAFACGQDVVQLIKRKLCELAVAGTLFSV